MAIPSVTKDSHCALCINAHRARHEATIFLDIHETLIKPHYELLYRSDQIDQDALNNLNILIDKVQQKYAVHIVLCFSYCQDDALKKLCEWKFKEYNFSKLIIGKTPPADSDIWDPALREGPSYESTWKKKYGHPFFSCKDKIDYWLRTHKFEDANFVILSDQMTLTDFGDRYICTYDSRAKKGLLTEEIVEKAAERLLNPNTTCWKAVLGIEFPTSCSDERIRREFPNRLMAGCNRMYFDKRFVPNLPPRTSLFEAAADKISRWYGKLLTPKGYSERNRQMTFPAHPETFPSVVTVKAVEEKLKNEIYDDLVRIKGTKENLEITADYLRGVLDVFKISLNYFPTDIKVKVHAYESGTILFAAGKGPVEFDQLV